MLQKKKNLKEKKKNPGRQNSKWKGTEQGGTPLACMKSIIEVNVAGVE